jgi:PTS system galactitol-specific IIB component
LKKIKIAVICGCGVASSTMIREKIIKVLQEKNLDANVVSGQVGEAASLAKDSDLFITVTPIPTDYGIPIIKGIAFLTGIGEEEVILSVLEKVKQLSA